MKKSLCSTIIVVALAFGAPNVAHAAPPDPESAALKAQADDEFDHGRFAEAYDLYKRAWTKSADPALLYNQSRALESMGEYPEALDKLEAFSSSAPAEVRAKVPKLNELIEELRRRLATIHVSTNVANSRLTLRGKDLGTFSGERTVRSRVGSATMTVEAEGYQPFTQELTLNGGDSVNVDAHLVAKKNEGVTSKWWFWTALGVVAVAGGTFAVIALTTEKDPDPPSFGTGPITVKGFRF